MGFIAYQTMEDAGAVRTVRIYIECSLEGGHPEVIGYTHSLDVQFASGGHAPRLEGIDGILALKKFYKLVFSLEERAREHGNDWRNVFASADSLIDHLDYTRNVRRLAADTPLLRRQSSDDGGRKTLDCRSNPTIEKA